MAISPQDANKVTKVETEKVDAAEKDIDLALKASYQGEGPVTVWMGRFGLNSRSQRDLKRRYERVGWSIKEGHSAGNQREPRDPSGPFWSFSARPTRGDDWADKD